jgi:iron complex outermembrane receptor protein
MPLSKVWNYGVFVIESVDWAAGHTEFGARFDSTQIELDPENIEPDERQSKNYYRDKSFNTVNLSLSHLFEITEHQGITWTLSRTERAPSVEELYYNGEHHATFSYQLDNPNLDTEKGISTELIWQYSHENWFVNTSVFYSRFSNFIYNQEIALHHEEEHEEEEHEHEHEHEHKEPTYRHAQAAADIYGIEFQLRYQPNMDIPWTIEALADGVRARLRSGDDKNLPRIPPVRLGLATTYRGKQWFAQADVRHHFKQANTAFEEPSSKAYTTLNMQARYSFPIKRSTAWVAIKGDNLTDSYGENATSYLKTIAPIMGRNIQLELGLQY